jgi:hypothetical protein
MKASASSSTAVASFSISGGLTKTVPGDPVQQLPHRVQEKESPA